MVTPDGGMNSFRAARGRRDRNGFQEIEHA
jgi:hypothetical protein